MSNIKLEKNEVFYHKDLNKLICCSDEYFNMCHNKDEYNVHLKSKIKRYTIDNSGEFHTGNFKMNNQWKSFIVVNSKFGGGGTGHGMYDIYEDAWQVYCSPIENNNIIIKFHQLTTSFAHTIDKVEIIKE